MDDKPKLRPITFDTVVLAYLGDYITMLEEGVKQIAIKEQQKVDDDKKKGK